jgi:signal transduction histidine kinase
MKNKKYIDGKLKRADESFILADKRRRKGELIIGIRALFYQNKENEKRAEDLILAFKELALQKEEKERQATELYLSNIELKSAELFLKEHIKELEEMMFIVSHKVRQPVTHIIGLSNLLDLHIVSENELKQSVDYIKQSAISLDLFTKELTLFICNLSQKTCNFKSLDRVGPKNILPEIKV